MRHPRLFGLHAAPGRRLSWLLAALPFLVIAAAYLIGWEIRLADNPNDKLLPPLSKMIETMGRMAFEPDKRSGDILLWADTAASLTRLGVGVLAGALVGLLIGLNTGLFPGACATFNPMVTVLSIVPPLTLLPILFIVFGVDELAKMVLIFIGTVFLIARDTHLAVRALPVEQVTKALTLGASQMAVVYRVVMPQILPRLIDTVRLTLGAAWLFLIAAEAVASTDGLGYRIFLVRRYLAMDVILPYVVWITLLAYTTDFLLRLVSRQAFPWYHDQRSETGT